MILAVAIAARALLRAWPSLKTGLSICASARRVHRKRGLAAVTGKPENQEEVFVMSRVASLAVLAVLCGGTVLAQPAPLGPCATDRVKLCKDVEPGNGRLLDCYAAHKAQLTSSCKAQVVPIIERRAQMKKQMPPKPLPMKTPATEMQKPPAPKSSG